MAEVIAKNRASVPTAAGNGVVPHGHSVTIVGCESTLNELADDLNEVRRRRIDDEEHYETADQQILVDGRLRYILRTRPDGRLQVLDADGEPVPKFEREYQEEHPVKPDATTAADLAEEEDDTPPEPAPVATAAPAEPLHTWPWHYKTVRSLARQEIRDAIEMYECAESRVAEVDQYLDDVTGKELTIVKGFEERAKETLADAKRALVHAILLYWGDVESRADFEADDFKWQARGVCAEERFVWCEPCIDSDGDASYDPDHATVTLCDLGSVSNLSASGLEAECDQDRGGYKRQGDKAEATTPPAEPLPWRAFRIKLAVPHESGSWITEEGRGTTLEDAIETARDQIQYEIDHGVRTDDRVIWEQDRIVARVLAADVLGPPFDEDDADSDD